MIFHSTYNKPVLLIGNGIRSANAVDLVYEFANKTNIPILTSMNGVDLAQDDLHIGFIGTHGNRVANMILNECDLLIAVGIRLGIRQVGKDSSLFAPHALLIRNDIDEYELSRDIKNNEIKYHTDAADFMKMLLNENIRDYSDWKNICLKAKDYLKSYDIQPGNEVIKRISENLPENAIVALDVGMNQCWAAQSLHIKGRYGRILVGGGFGAMGCGLPYAIGASIATDYGKVYCICGDGGLQMNIQELETIKREKLPVKIFVLNNRVLGKISETQHFNHNDRFASTTTSGGYTVPNFSAIANAYGINSIKIDTLDDLDKNYNLINDNMPCLFDISLPEKSFLTPKIKFETGLISPRLDDDKYREVISILRSID